MTDPSTLTPNPNGLVPVVMTDKADFAALGWNPGEIRGFGPDAAAALIDKGLATPYVAPAAPASKSSK